MVHCHGMLHKSGSDQETHFTAKEMQQWADGHRNHWPSHVPYHPEAAGLIEWPTEDTVTALAKWQ